MKPIVRQIKAESKTLDPNFIPQRLRERYKQRSKKYRFLLRWWEWGKVLGVVSLVLLAALLASGHVPPPAVVAILLHLVVDFTLQSSETASHKAERGRHLLIHALVAGGLPLAMAGLLTRDPRIILVWMIAGASSHYAVDWTRRFGVRPLILSVLLDQGCHLLTILLLTWLF